MRLSGFLPTGWGCGFFKGIGDLGQTPFPEKTEEGAARGKGDVIVHVEGGVGKNGLPVDPDGSLPGEVLHPVPVLAEKYLRMQIENPGGVENEFTLRAFSDRDRQFPERADGGAELNHQRGGGFLDRDLPRFLPHRRGPGFFPWNGSRGDREGLDGDLLPGGQRNIPLPNLRQETDLRPPGGKLQDIPAFQGSVLDPFSVHQRAVGAVIDQLEPVAFTDDIRLFPGDDGEIRGEPDVAGGVSPDGDLPMRKLLDLSFQWTRDVNELDNDNRGAIHRFRRCESSARSMRL